MYVPYLRDKLLFRVPPATKNQETLAGKTRVALPLCFPRKRISR